MTVLRHLCLPALLLLTACAPAAIAAPSPSPTATRSIQLAVCGEEQVRQIIGTFIDAFNGGDDPARLFAPSAEPGISEQVRFTSRFTWYASSGGGLPHVAIYERKDLAAYFAQRHAASERISLMSLTYPPNQLERYPRADLSVLVTRTAADLQPLRDVVGKAAVNCRDQTVLVWVM